MSKPAKTVLWFGIYLVVAGLGFAIALNMQLRLLGVAETNEPWLRVLGIIVFLLGCYYIGAARADSRWFIRATTKIRLIPPVAFTLLVVLDLAPAILTVFGIIDGLGALWTWAALRSSEKTS